MGALPPEEHTRSRPGTPLMLDQGFTSINSAAS